MVSKQCHALSDEFLKAATVVESRPGTLKLISKDKIVKVFNKKAKRDKNKVVASVKSSASSSIVPSISGIC